MRWVKYLAVFIGVVLVMGIGTYALSVGDIFKFDGDRISLSPQSFDCSDNQVIMRVSNEFNAHAGIWNSSYDKKICYNEIFGSNYEVSPGVNPHNCNVQSSNKVIKLSTLKNSHSSSINVLSSDFNQTICYGDLYCQISTNECSGNYKLIASLSSEFNGHVSADDIYPINICCVANPSPQDVNPTLTIVKPEKSSSFTSWKKFSINQDISFEQESYAIVDWAVNWSLGDGRVKYLNNCATSNCNTSEFYTQQAHYTIRAYAKEQSGLLRSSPTDHTDILVYKEGINLFAIITEPQFNQTISGGSTVRFNAKDSFVASCNATQCSAPVGENCYEVGPQQNKLYCYNLLKPGQSGAPNYKFWYEWTFDPGKPYQSMLNGTWNDNYNQVVEFNKTFVEEGQHFASLRVGYEAA